MIFRRHPRSFSSAAAPLALGLLLTTACGKTDQASPPSTEPAPASVPAASAPAEKAPPAPAVEKVKEKESTPQASSAYVRTGDKAKNIDDFSFLGWSADSRYFAFETHYHGPHMANCEGEAALTVVDATSDTIAPGGHTSFKYPEPEASECGPSPSSRLSAAAPAALSKYGIQAQTAGTPDRLVSEHQLYSFAQGTLAQKIEFFVKHKAENYEPEGASYFLALVEADGQKQIVEPGTKRRKYVMNYDLESSMAFLSPNKKQLALFVGMTMTDAEGPRHSWMSNGITLK